MAIAVPELGIDRFGRGRREQVDRGGALAWIHRFARALHLARLARPLPVRVGPHFFPAGRSHPDGALRAGKGS